MRQDTSMVVEVGEEENKMVKAYCMKCKKMMEMSKPTKTKMKNGRMALKGTCAKCGTKMFKIGGA